MARSGKRNRTDEADIGGREYVALARCRDALGEGGRACVPLLRQPLVGWNAITSPTPAPFDSLSASGCFGSAARCLLHGISGNDS